MIRRWFQRLFPPRRPLAPMYHATKVRLFIKPYCPWCHRAIHWLDKHGIEYEELDVVSDAAARREMNQISGQDLAPVVEADGEVLADFDPEELEEFWRELGKKKS